MCAPIPPGKWAWKYDQCIRCSTKEKRHKGRGLCISCWDKKRSNNPKRQAYAKVNHDKWYAKVKGTPEYIDYVNKRAEEWRNFSPQYRIFLKKQYKRLKFRRIAVNQVFKKGRVLKRNQGLQYRCDICPNHLITSPISPQDVNYKVGELELFKKEMRKLCLKVLSN